MLPVPNMLPRQRQVLARFSVSALVASLPLLYVSLLRPPPAVLAGDTAFWFLMSNCVIAAIVAADDAGALFFGSKVDPSCEYDGGVLSCVSAGDQPAAACEDSRGAVVPLVASDVDAPTVVHMEGGRAPEELASMMASQSPIMDNRALPFLVQNEGAVVEDAASKSSTDFNDASVLQRGHEDGVAIEPSTDKYNTVMVEGPSSVGPDEIGIIKNDRALAGPEPELACPVTSVSIVEDVHEVDATEAWAIARYSRTPDRWQGNSVVSGSEGKLQRSATEGSKPAAEESEYWELSDEELNRKVEDFIARFNREMRRQIEQEAGV